MDLRLLADAARLVAPACCPLCHAPLALAASPPCRACELTVESLDRLGVATGPLGAPVVAAYRYGGPVATAITQAKFGHQPPAFGGLLNPWAAAAIAQAAAAGVEVWIAVPPQRDRLRERGWHLPDLLASTLAAAGPWPAKRALCRVDGAAPRATGSRTAPVFEQARRGWPWPKGWHLEGRAVALVDDVLTTGETLSAAARAICEAGGRVVMFAVLADARASDRTRLSFGLGRPAVGSGAVSAQGIQAEATRQPAAPPTRRRPAAH